jgi:hypothetical protein
MSTDDFHSQAPNKENALPTSCLHLPSSQELKPHLPLLSLPLLSSQHATLSHTSHRNNITTNVMFTPLAHNIASANCPRNWTVIDSDSTRQPEAMATIIPLPTSAVQALEDLQAHAQAINVPDTRAEVCHKLRQLEEALRSLAGEKHALEFKNRDLYLQNVYLGLQHEKKAKQFTVDVERERKEKQQALDMRDSLLEIVKELKTVLEAEKKKSLEEHQRGEVQEKLQQLRIAEE